MTTLAMASEATTVLALVAGIEAATFAQAVTATVGFFVAYQAYRGYRRNDSRPMLFLGVGIAFVTTGSFVVSTLVVSPLGASEPVTVLSWVVSNVVGLAAILYAFTGASSGRHGGGRRRPGGPDGTPEDDASNRRQDGPDRAPRDDAGRPRGEGDP